VYFTESFTAFQCENIFPRAKPAPDDKLFTEVCITHRQWFFMSMSMSCMLLNKSSQRRA